MTRLLTVVLLAAPQPGDYDPSTGKGPEWGKAAPIGLLVILLLGVAVFFLLRSFTRQLKKVPASFDTGPDDTGPDGTEPDGAGPESAASVVPAGSATEQSPPARPAERGPTGSAGPAG